MSPIGWRQWRKPFLGDCVSPHENRMRALNLLDDAEALKTKASELASNPDDPGSFFDDIMILLTIAHLNATMAQAYVALAELND